MKTHTSRTLRTIAFIYMAFPATYLLAAALLFDIPASLCVSILLSPSFWLLSLFAAISGFGLWEMRRWAWHLFIYVNVLITYTNARIVAEFSASHHQLIAFFIALVSLIAVVMRVSRELRVPYFLPRIRWWENNPRYRLAVHSKIERVNGGGTLEGDILDLSVDGAFVKLRHELPLEEPLLLQFTLFGQELSCPCEVVWHASSAVTHPKGVGLKFSAPSRVQKRALRAIQARLRRINRLYRTSRFLMNQDEFDKRMHDLMVAQVVLTKIKAKGPTALP